MSTQKKRQTMVKPRVGCSMATTRNLPPNHFVYGMKNQTNQEGAGDVISNWVTADPSASKDSVRSHVHSNILAIKHGCCTAKAQRKFAEDHVHIKMKEILNTDMGSQSSSFEGPFGRVTKYADETILEIVQTKFTNYENDDSDYPDVKGLVDKSAPPHPRSTKASQQNETRNARNEHEGLDNSQSHRFVMKKFQNIPGKLNLPKVSSPNKPETTATNN